MTSREDLIEEAAKAIYDAAWQGLEGEVFSDVYARIAFAVFEKAHAPTDDEREALIAQATWALIEYDTDVSDRGVRDEHYRDRRADVERVFPILFRRSEVPESQGERRPCRLPHVAPPCIGCKCGADETWRPQGEPTGHRAILIQEARSHADDYRRYDDTEGLVGTLVEMANMLAAHDAEEPEWEYVPGWIGDDGRARISAGTIEPDYVAQYLAEGGEVVRRRVSKFEPVKQEGKTDG